MAPPPPSSNIVGCKWVYRIKRKQNGEIDRYKTHLVVEGFNQREGIDFQETFSPVIKATTIRTTIALVASYGWK